MNKTLTMFSESLNQITTEQTKFGGVANRMEMTTSTLETNTENLTTYLSQINDIDYAEAITQWMNAQYAYQASMQVSSASMNMSLLNYMQ
jgi:flagellar hook-associated protein 3 FlgL